MTIPTLQTERLILRGWREDDIPAAAEIMTDPEAAAYIGGAAPAWQPFRTICSFIGHWQLRGFGFFAVERKAERDCIGWCGLWRPAGWPDNEIGYALHPRVWRQGYASEAAKASLRFAYDTVGWTTAISLIDHDNPASQGVARKLGAEREQRDVAINDFTADIWRHLSPEQFRERFA